jgi:hypothetical protein
MPALSAAVGAIADRLLTPRGGQQPPVEQGALARAAQTLLAEAGPGDAQQWLSESTVWRATSPMATPPLPAGHGPRSDIVLDEGYVARAAALSRERRLLAGRAWRPS